MTIPPARKPRAGTAQRNDMMPGSLDQITKRQVLRRIENMANDAKLANYAG